MPMPDSDKLHFPNEEIKTLFLKQKELLDTFLSHGAISKAQYDVSYHGLIEKMHLLDETAIEVGDTCE